VVLLDSEVVARDAPGTVEALLGLASGGIKLIVSAPNPILAADPPVAPGEGPGSPLAPLAELPGAIVLEQFAAEGSLIRSGGDAELESELALPEHGESDYANYLIACVNFEPSAIHEARMELRVAPQYNRQLRNLEVANRELRSANAALARDWLGKRDTASASTLNRLREAEEERDKVLNSLSWKITAPLRAVKAFFKPSVREYRQKRRDEAKRI
jgi:hypothetical protein